MDAYLEVLKQLFLMQWLTIGVGLVFTVVLAILFVILAFVLDFFNI